MPPKAKFTKNEIIKAAFEITKAEGIDALTARALGAKLGSSARPIFTVFQSMDEVQAEVWDAAETQAEQLELIMDMQPCRSPSLYLFSIKK